MTSTPTPATNAQISEWEYEAEQPHPNHQDWRILQLCARIKAEREKTIKECAAIALDNLDQDISELILALLTNKGEQP